jgi:hypothetical protein
MQDGHQLAASVAFSSLLGYKNSQTGASSYIFGPIRGWPEGADMVLQGTIYLALKDLPLTSALLLAMGVSSQRKHSRPV